MSRKTVKSLLVLATELKAIVKLADDEIIAITVYGASSMLMHLRPAPFVRAARQFGITRQKLRRASTENHWHFHFTARGCDWACIVRRDEAESILQQFNPRALTERRAALVHREQPVSHLLEYTPQ